MGGKRLRGERAGKDLNKERGKDLRKEKGEDRGGKKGLRGERRERISTGRGGSQQGEGGKHCREEKGKTPREKGP